MKCETCDVDSKDEELILQNPITILDSFKSKYRFECHRHNKQELNSSTIFTADHSREIEVNYA